MARPWLSRTDLVIVGLSATRRTWLSPAPTEDDWKAKMFTPRSASARQVFPRVPGWSCILMVNSLAVGMVGTSFASTFWLCFYSCAPVEIKQHDQVPLLSVGEMQVVSIRGV